LLTNDLFRLKQIQLIFQNIRRKGRFTKSEGKKVGILHKSSQQRISKVQPLKLMDWVEALSKNSIMQPRHLPGNSRSTGTSQDGVAIFVHREQQSASGTGFVYT
jgi:hypothetical protein